MIIDLNVLPETRGAAGNMELPLTASRLLLVYFNVCRPCGCNYYSETQQRKYCATGHLPNCRKIPSTSCIAVASLMEHLLTMLLIYLNSGPALQLIQWPTQNYSNLLAQCRTMEVRSKDFLCFAVGNVIEQFLAVLICYL